MKINKLYRILIIVIVFYACKKQLNKYSVEEYKEWINTYENELQKDKKIGVYNFKLHLIPGVVYELREKQSEQSKIHTKDNFMYFKLSISVPEYNNEPIRAISKDIMDYQDKYKHFTIDYKYKIRIKSKNKEVVPGLYIPQPTYNLKPANIVLFAALLPNDWRQHQLQIEIHDDLFGVGIVKFTFLPEQLKEIPILKN